MTDSRERERERERESNNGARKQSRFIIFSCLILITFYSSYLLCTYLVRLSEAQSELANIDFFKKYQVNALVDDFRTSPTKLLTPTSAISMESTPIEFHGDLYLISSVRQASAISSTNRVRIDNLDKNILVGLIEVGDISLISAFVYEEKVYIFGATGHDKRNELKMLVSSDLVHWSQPVTVVSASEGQIIFNNSVTKDKYGFTMAYEVSEPGVTIFTPRFAKSTDLVNWTPMTRPFNTKEYSACPTIRYVNDHYYMFYLANRRNKYITLLARSTDLENWQYGTHAAFVPTKEEGINNSDVDLVEHGKSVLFFYFTGDQQRWGNLQSAEYKGDLVSYLEKFQFHGQFLEDSIRLVDWLTRTNKP